MSAFDDVVRLRCYAEQRGAWEECARYEGMDLSAFIRHILDREAQRYEEVIDFPDPAAVLLGQAQAATV